MIGFLNAIEEEFVTPKRRAEDESEAQKVVNDAIDRLLIGTMKVKAAERVIDPLTNKAMNWLTGNQDLSQEKTKLEIELMKRQLSNYSDDDRYEKALNKESSAISPLLVAANVRRYAETGKTLAETLIGDIDNAGLIQRLIRRR